MPRTTFVRVSKTFPATIINTFRFCLDSDLGAVWLHGFLRTNVYMWQKGTLWRIQIVIMVVEKIGVKNSWGKKKYKIQKMSSAIHVWIKHATEHCDSPRSFSKHFSAYLGILCLAISWQWCKHASKRVHPLFVFVCVWVGVCDFNWHARLSK